MIQSSVLSWRLCNCHNRFKLWTPRIDTRSTAYSNCLYVCLYCVRFHSVTADNTLFTYCVLQSEGVRSYNAYSVNEKRSYHAFTRLPIWIREFEISEGLISFVRVHTLGSLIIIHRLDFKRQNQFYQVNCGFKFLLIKYSRRYNSR